MANTIKKPTNSRSLGVEKLRIDEYKILSVDVAKDLDQQGRRFAIATVVNRNDTGNWGGNVHLIELKHCYNKYSKGPNHTPYEKLTGCILVVSNIQTPLYGDLDMVWCELLPSNISR